MIGKATPSVVQTYQMPLHRLEEVLEEVLICLFLLQFSPSALKFASLSSFGAGCLRTREIFVHNGEARSISGQHIYGSSYHTMMITHQILNSLTYMWSTAVL